MSVALKKQLFQGVSNKELVQQIEGRRKCKRKLPNWYKTPLIYYPNRQAIEQCSSESTAAYKSRIITGSSLLDLTGGFGVDSYYFSKSFSQITYCERQEDLAEIARHNFEKLDAKNIKVLAIDGLEFLNNSDQKFDCIYLDPSRRKKTGQRIISLIDAEPSLPESLSPIWQHTDLVLIKTSPLLDIVSGLKVLGEVKEVHIVALENEVKELVWVLQKGCFKETEIKSINIKSAGDQSFNFYLVEERSSKSVYGKALKYIYEPNSAILKAGAFGLIGQRYGLLKLHPHTHLYTSDKIREFPGRRYKLIDSFSYNTRLINRLKLRRAHIIGRNFPKSVEELRKKFKLKEGGDKTLIFTRDPKGALVVLLCRQIQSSASVRC